MEELIARGLDALGLTVPPGAAGTLDRYGRLLLEKNRVMNLTAIREPEGVARLHMLDCAALLAAPGADFAGKALIDIGTGAGFPGMVLKILSPTSSLTLLDSLNKRLDWLAEVCGTLGLEGVRAVHGRAEERSRDPALRERFDLVTARAVADLRTLCELCLPYARVGGAFLAMKSVESDRELAEADNAVRTLGGTVESVWDYQIPETEIRHRAIRIRKTSATPERYPRPFARIKKSPL